VTNNIPINYEDKIAKLLPDTCPITWISAVSVSHWLIFVLDEILHVSHFVVSSEKVVHDNPAALLDPAE
jgi:hypothetical protein